MSKTSAPAALPDTHVISCFVDALDALITQNVFDSKRNSQYTAMFFTASRNHTEMIAMLKNGAKRDEVFNRFIASARGTDVFDGIVVRKVRLAFDKYPM